MVNRRVLGQLFRPGISAATSLPTFTRIRPSSVTRPIVTPCRSHLLKIASTSFSRPFCAISNIRSCDSLSMISYGVMPGLAFRHEIQIDLVARAAAAGRLAGRTGQPRRAHVLNADHQPVLCASLPGRLPAAASP